MSFMTSLSELKARRDIVHRIDWTMTPEKAVDMYLEWGAGWCRGNDFVSSAQDESIYFVIYDWEIPHVTLLRRTSGQVEEIAKIPADRRLVERSIEQGGKRPGVGVYPLSYGLKKWLSEALDGPPVERYSGLCTCRVCRNCKPEYRRGYNCAALAG